MSRKGRGWTALLAAAALLGALVLAVSRFPVTTDAVSAEAMNREAEALRSVLRRVSDEAQGERGPDQQEDPALPGVFIDTGSAEEAGGAFIPARIRVLAEGYKTIDKLAEIFTLQGDTDKAGRDFCFLVVLKRINHKGRVKEDDANVLEMGEQAEWLIVSGEKEAELDAEGSRRVALTIDGRAFGSCIMLPHSETDSGNPEETAEIDRLNADRGRGVAVEPLLPIEETWDIEDEHAEASGPLVTWMTMGGQELGFDRETNTFYCTLGMDREEWPELSLTAGGAEGLRAAWVDDYAWDEVRSSIRDNVSYQLIAWTKEKYAYFRLVFTGLPIVTLHVTDYDGLGDEYMPARCTVSAAGYEGVDLPARTHLRSGGYSKRFDKWSYRVEFEQRTNGGYYTQKRVSLLGVEEDSDWLLISNASDDTLVRNHLGMELWKKWNPDGGPGVLESRLVEVFVQDQYMGIYQLLQRINPRKEIPKLGGSLESDGVSRIIKAKNIGERPVWRLWNECNFVLEMRQTPGKLSLGGGKRIFGDFVELQKVATSGEQLPDEAFAELAARCADARQVIGYFLFTQAAGLPYDNVFNNVYVYGAREGDHYVYRLSPWDMDMGFQQLFRDQKDNLNEWMELPVRMMNLDVAGARKIAWETWAEKRASILSEDAIYEWMTDVETLANDSGAFLRETEKWDGGAVRLNIEPLRYFTIEHMETIERYLQEEWMLQE